MRDDNNDFAADQQPRKLNMTALCNLIASNEHRRGIESAISYTIERATTHKKK